MRDPYMIENQAYLRDLEKLAVSKIAPTYRVKTRRAANIKRRAIISIGVIVAVVAFVPWNTLPI